LLDRNRDFFARVLRNKHARQRVELLEDIADMLLVFGGQLVIVLVNLGGVHNSVVERLSLLVGLHRLLRHRCDRLSCRGYLGGSNLSIDSSRATLNSAGLRLRSRTRINDRKLVGQVDPQSHA
jgi:hypothetical protein